MVCVVGELGDAWPAGAVISMGPLRVRVEDQVVSTHEELWARRRWVEPGTGVAASSQTSGVGRAGTRWESPEGGLYVSVLAGAGTPAAETDTLGEAASIAVLETAAEVVPGVDVFLKWPNDAVVRMPRNRVGKVAGVVVRADTDGTRVLRAVISVGLNMEATIESAQVEAGPTVPASLEGAGRRAGAASGTSRAQVLEWLVGFLALYLERARVDPEAVRSRYGKELRRAPLRARVPGVKELFRPTGVVRGGALKVRRESGRVAEVSVSDAQRLEWQWLAAPSARKGGGRTQPKKRKRAARRAKKRAPSAPAKARGRRREPPTATAKKRKVKGKAPPGGKRGARRTKPVKRAAPRRRGAGRGARR